MTRDDDRWLILAEGFEKVGEVPGGEAYADAAELIRRTLAGATREHLRDAVWLRLVRAKRQEMTHA